MPFWARALANQLGSSVVGGGMSYGCDALPAGVTLTSPNQNLDPNLQASAPTIMHLIWIHH